MIFFTDLTAHVKIFDDVTNQTRTFPKGELLLHQHGNGVDVVENQGGVLYTFEITNIDPGLGITEINALSILRDYFYECCECPPDCVPGFTFTMSPITATPPGGGPGTLRTLTGALLWTGNACCAGNLTMQLMKAYVATPNNSIAYTGLILTSPPGWTFPPVAFPVAFQARFNGPSALTAAGTHYVFALTACGVTKLVDLQL